MDFYFPTNVLTSEDFTPVQVMALKDYYKNYLFKLIDDVKIYFLYFKPFISRWGKINQKGFL